MAEWVQTRSGLKIRNLGVWFIDLIHVCGAPKFTSLCVFFFLTSSVVAETAIGMNFEEIDDLVALLLKFLCCASGLWGTHALIKTRQRYVRCQAGVRCLLHHKKGYSQGHSFTRRKNKKYISSGQFSYWLYLIIICALLSLETPTLFPASVSMQSANISGKQRLSSGFGGCPWFKKGTGSRSRVYPFSIWYLNFNNAQKNVTLFLTFSLKKEWYLFSSLMTRPQTFYIYY